jgi:hypothetical protein
MLGGLAQAGAKVLRGARFSMVNLVPAAFLVSFVAVLVASNAYTGADVRIDDVVQNIGKHPGWAVVAIFGIFVLALVMRPFQAALVQLLEGYWSTWRVLGGAASLAAERHRRIRHTAGVLRDFYDDFDDTGAVSASIKDVARYQRIQRKSQAHEGRVSTKFLRYPKPRRPDDGYDEYDHRLLPTLLGNTFRNGEDTAGDRYGLDLPVVAPRLAQFLAPKLDREIGQSLDLIDTTSAMCVSFALAGLASAPLAGRLDLWSLLPLVMTLLAILAYRGAIRLARGHRRLLETAFDLYRFDMIKGLHYGLPPDPRAERAFNLALSDFLAGRTSLAKHQDLGNVPFVHPSDDEASAPEASPAAESGGAAAAGGSA